MSGHLFVIQADLTALFCDAWLLPADREFCLVDYWIPAEYQSHFQRLTSRTFRADIESTDDWEIEGQRTILLETWPHPIKPFITNVGGSATHPATWYAESARQFLHAAAAQGAIHTGRERPLIALPAIGTGYGGQWRKKAGVIETVMRTIYDVLNEVDADVAFVAFDAPTYAAAQAVRRKLQEELNVGFPLSDTLRQQAEGLANRANAGELVLFLGAGVSAGAGLPLWGELLSQLAEQANLSEEETAALQQLDVMDQGLIVERRLGGRDRLESAIAQLVNVRHHSISHSLLAALPTDAVVTLNYDTLFERASHPIVGPVAVIPDERAMAAKRWLLKLHGCIHRGELVLTREDYMRFGDRRAALAGIVQSLLITRHMLFIGFGMSDPNLFRILDDVRKAVSPHARSGKVGTVLALEPNPLRDALWDDDLHLAHMSETHAVPFQTKVRSLEIFLDYLSSLASAHAGHIMDQSFETLLTDSEREFRDQLIQLKQKFSHRLGESRVWYEFERFLNALGDDNT